MDDYKIEMNIKVTNQKGEQETHTILVDAIIPEKDSTNISKVEQVFLALNKEAIRRAVAVYLEELSKKKPEISKAIEAEIPRQILSRIESTEK